MSSTDVKRVAAEAIARSKQLAKERAEDESKEQTDAMAALERQARAPLGFVPASTGPEGGNRPMPGDEGQPPQPAAAATANPDAIDIDEDMEADEDQEAR
jgi:pre-mRNA-splicing factor SYF1